MYKNLSMSIVGCGNIGSSIAAGLLQSGRFDPAKIILTRRNVSKLEALKKQGFETSADNSKAVSQSRVIIVAVEPQQVNGVLQEISPLLLPERHTVISVVSGITILQIKEQLAKNITVIRAMPNTAIAIRESMTCLALNNGDQSALQIALDIFNTVGATMQIDEEHMTAATALGACGIAYFLRAIRAASQGGIEIGFHSDKAYQIAAQTAKGAAQLLLQGGGHPEAEIDRVTTPRGVTISGLNQMEHAGFSSAMIRGIVTSWNKAQGLYKNE